MTSIRALRDETTLATIAQDPNVNQKYLLFAVVIDASESQKTSEGQNYVTKLKIIDPSFNYKAELKVNELRFHKFVHINVYSEKPEEGPKIKSVGDIIRLRRFKFKYTEKGEVMGNDLKYSNWLIYSAVPENNDIAISYKMFAPNVNRKLNPDEANRVSDLRKWSQIFFANNSLIYINWWQGLKEIEDSSKASANYDKVDLILKCKSTEVLGAKKFKLNFFDRDNKHFELNIEQKPSIKVNQVIKLRCVNVTVPKNKDQARVVKLTDHSSCLMMPAFSSDYKQFEKVAVEQKRSPSKSTKIVDPFINDYQIEEVGQSKSSKSTPKKGPKAKEEKYVTAVKKIYNTKKVSTVEDLLKCLKNYNQNHGQKFLVKGHIDAFQTTDPKEIIKFLHTEDRRHFILGEKLDQPKKMRAIYGFGLQIRDDSIADNHAALDIYIQTDNYNSHMFSLWKVLPEYDEINAWVNMKDNKLKEFQKKLDGLKGKENSVKFILELFISKKGNPFFKVVDTIFLA